MPNDDRGRADDPKRGIRELAEKLDRIKRDLPKARTYRDRWLKLMRAELQQMKGEGIDPWIAWLSLKDVASGSVTVTAPIDELQPNAQ